MTQSVEHGFDRVMTVNGKSLSCALLAVTAWYLWPVSWVDDWRSGVIALIAAVFALVSLVQLLVLLSQLHARNRAIAKFEAQGARPKSACLATRDALKAAGMLDE